MGKDQEGETMKNGNVFALVCPAMGLGSYRAPAAPLPITFDEEGTVGVRVIAKCTSLRWPTQE